MRAWISILAVLSSSVACGDPKTGRSGWTTPAPINESESRDAGDATERDVPMRPPSDGAPLDSDSAVEGSDGAGLDADSSVAPPVTVLPAPQPVPACGEDLGVLSGTIVPALGKVPEGLLSSPNLAGRGPYQVLEHSVDIPIPGGVFDRDSLHIEIEPGTLKGTTYAPSTNGKSLAEGPMPLVVVLPGFSVGYAFYASFARHFASYGFAVLGVDTRSNLLTASHDTEALEVSQTLDWVLGDRSPFAASLDREKVVLSGHSKGGKLAFFAAVLDARVDLVIAWDPSNAGGPPCFISSDCHSLPVAPNCAVQDSGLIHQIHAESLIFGAPPRPANPEEAHNAKHFYRGAPSPAALVEMDTEHIAWADTLGDPAIQATTRAAQMAVLLDRFKGVSGLSELEPGGAHLRRADKVSFVLTK